MIFGTVVGKKVNFNPCSRLVPGDGVVHSGVRTIELLGIAFKWLASEVRRGD